MVTLATASLMVTTFGTAEALGEAAPAFEPTVPPEVAAASVTETARVVAPASYVGSAACGPCHAAEIERWRESPHAIALRPAEAPGVLRDLAEPLTVAYGKEAKAILRGGEHPSVEIFETDVDAGPYDVAFVLGGRVLSQPLVRFPAGRYQALPIGYDHEKREWFDIFAKSPRNPEDWGHWTNRGMTANSECIACHVTGFRKGYHAAQDTYETTYAEAGVGCEACHGPGSRHVEVRTRVAETTEAGRHATAAEDAYATPTGEVLLAVCASCHGLRRELTAEFTPGMELLDAFEPVLLQEGDYHADGSVAEEAYEWGSFVQSRMHAKGVVCADCHEAHSGALKAQGDALCRSCHDVDPKTKAHSHHDDASDRTTCVSCHMAESVFMERDRRGDHAFTLPDPALSELAGSKSPCLACHGEKTEAWASEHVEQWFPKTADVRAKRRALVDAFVRAAAGDPGHINLVIEAARSRSESAIRRATATKLLAPFARAMPASESRAPAREVEDVLLELARDEIDLVRYAAVWSLAEASSNGRHRIESALIAASADPRRAVRANAAWGLRALDRAGLEQITRTTLERASADLLSMLAVRADSAEARFTAGSFYEAKGETNAAMTEYRGALGIAPASIPPRYRLALLLSSSGRVDEAIDELATLVDYEPRFAPAHFALGLLYGEQEEWREAVRSLTECLKIDPYHPGALHDLAHAYLGLDQGELAAEVLEAALTHSRSRREALTTLVSVHLALGERETAKRWAEQAVGEMPALRSDPSLAALLGTQE